ncbi:MAG TPA: neuraminidase-like domain-containing protein, partial [Ktedonobacteraceae bacterium]|nr:neuraminidase-like domain-containing protein [Ktedonobacteraceae bacterium]
SLLSLAGLTTAELRAKFATLYAQHRGTDEDFYRQLSQQSEFARDSLVENLRATLALDELVQNHLPMVHVIQNQLETGQLKALADLVGLGEEEWLSLVHESTAGVSRSIQGRDETERARIYAAALKQQVEQTYTPSAATSSASASLQERFELEQQKPSPFFQEMENELAHDKVTPEIARNAFLHYLEKLQDTAYLEICGMYHQVEAQGKAYDLPFVVPESIVQQGSVDLDILHVFARTPNVIPHAYYYRQLQNGRTWTSWEHVDLGMEEEEEALLPVVYADRLYLFWPVFGNQPALVSSDPQLGSASQGLPNFSRPMRIAWNEYHHERWQPPKISAASIPVQTSSDSEAASHLVFRSMLLSDLLILFCYLDIPASSEEMRQVGYYVFSRDSGPFLVGKMHSLGDIVANQKWIDALVELAPATWAQIGQAAIELFGPSTWSPPALGVLVSIGMLGPGAFSQSLVGRLIFAEQAAGTEKGPPAFLVDKEAYVTLAPVHGNPEVVLLELQLHRLLYGETLANKSQDLSFLPLLDLLKVQFLQSGRGAYFVHTQIKTNRTPRPSNRRLQALRRDSLYQLAANLPVRQTGIKNIFTPEISVAPPANQPIAAPDGQTFSVDMLANTLLEVVPAYQFEPFFHPQVRRLLDGFKRDRLDEVMRELSFEEECDFSAQGACSGYNWEIFVSLPLLLANRLTQNQHFAEAQQWLHCLFKPVEGDQTTSPDHVSCWNACPLYQDDAPASFHEVLSRSSQAASLKMPEEACKVATYQKIVMAQYLDNLLAWGDQLLSLNLSKARSEATRLYSLAAEILGPRPDSELHTPEADHALESSRTNDKGIIFSGQAEDEQLLAFAERLPKSEPARDSRLWQINPDDPLLKYWDTVAYRLARRTTQLEVEQDSAARAE